MKKIIVASLAVAVIIIVGIGMSKQPIDISRTAPANTTELLKPATTNPVKGTPTKSTTGDVLIKTTTPIKNTPSTTTTTPKPTTSTQQPVKETVTSPTKESSVSATTTEETKDSGSIFSRRKERQYCVVNGTSVTYGTQVWVGWWIFGHWEFLPTAQTVTFNTACWAVLNVTV